MVETPLMPRFPTGCLPTTPVVRVGFTILGEWSGFTVRGFTWPANLSPKPNSIGLRPSVEKIAPSLFDFREERACLRRAEPLRGD